MPYVVDRPPPVGATGATAGLGVLALLAGAAVVVWAMSPKTKTSRRGWLSHNTRARRVCKYTKPSKTYKQIAC